MFCYDFALKMTKNNDKLYNPDVQGEFHITLCCAKFNYLRVKYIQPYYYRRPSMLKFVELMITENRQDIQRLMVFLKLTFKLYLATLLE